MKELNTKRYFESGPYKGYPCVIDETYTTTSEEALKIKEEFSQMKKKLKDILSKK